MEEGHSALGQQVPRVPPAAVRPEPTQSRTGGSPTSGVGRLETPQLLSVGHAAKAHLQATFLLEAPRLFSCTHMKTGRFLCFIYFS